MGGGSHPPVGPRAARSPFVGASAVGRPGERALAGQSLPFRLANPRVGGLGRRPPPAASGPRSALDPGPPSAGQAALATKAFRGPAREHLRRRSKAVGSSVGGEHEIFRRRLGEAAFVCAGSGSIGVADPGGLGRRRGDQLERRVALVFDGRRRGRRAVQGAKPADPSPGRDSRLRETGGFDPADLHIPRPPRRDYPCGLARRSKAMGGAKRWMNSIIRSKAL